SKRQPIVALSSTEAEYIALSSTTREILWLKQLEREIDKSAIKTASIYCDNQSAIKLGEIDAFRPRTKHIDIRHHHIREKIEDNSISLKYVSTKQMVADSLTKAVTKEKTQFCAKEMGINT
ncbi:MAG TPA: hypothetical protein DDZ41_10875, partial [Flavobacterium sp.]|nr:hypothetical protein [Flavobacterium sp.]